MIKKIILIIMISVVFGCENKIVEDNITFKDDYGYYQENNVTYRFTGTSEHFAFETGKVYYGDNDERYILLKNFKILDNLKNINSINTYSINLSFNDIPLLTKDMIDLNQKTLLDALKNYSLEEYGVYNISGHGESDAFTRTLKEQFKESIKLEIKYCYKTNDCKTEEFKLNYYD